MKTSFTRQRPFTVAWSGLLAALLVLGSLTSFAGGACENATQWPTSAVTVTGTDVITINGCNYEEEYSQITGIQAGASYEFTADGPSTYITIRQGSVGGTVLAAGFSPLTGVAATADDIYVHWSADASCATAASCITTTVQDVTPPCENSSQWPTSTYDVSAGSGVQSISTCVYAGDYSVVTGLTAGNYYQVTVEGGNYITVREGAVDGPVVAEGTGITALVSSGADLYIHYNTEAISCGTASTCLEATIEDQGVPPCENTSLWPSAATTASAVDGETVTISTNAYVGSEYSIINGIQNGYQYEVSHAAGSYVTVRTGAVDGPVLASGLSPLAFSGGADATVYVHWTVDASCTQDATGSWTTQITSIGFPECENASLWPSSAVTAGASGAGPVNISTNQYSSGEYSIVTGIVASSEYEITHANGVFITVREGAVDGPVIASGFSPLTVATATTADLYIHWNEDQACSEDPTGSYLTTIENLGVACVADAGTITADVDELCFDAQTGSVTISATPDGNQVVPAGFTTLYVLTDASDPNLPILGIEATPSFVVNAVGDYIIHTFVFDPADQATYLAETTGAGVAALLLENGGTLCGSLDVTGAPVSVLDCPDNDLCENAIPVACGDAVDGTTVNGTTSPEVTTGGIGVWYTFEGNGQDVTFSTCGNANFDTEITVLTGTCGSLTTLDSNDDFTGCSGSTSELTVYAEFGTTYYVYVSHWLNSSTTTGDFTLSVTCACPPSLDAGTLTADASTVCLDGGSADLSATEGTAPGVPAGYTVTYVLTSGGTDYVIEAVSSTPDFTVTAAGEYTIHTLVSTGTLNLTTVVFGTTTAADVLGIVSGDDNICAALDVTGSGTILVEGPTAGTLTAVETPVCLVGGSADISAVEGDAPTVPTDYQVLYVLTEGAGLVIVDAGATPDFTVTAEGDYTIHTLVYNPATLDLSGVVFGTTTGFDVNGLLVQGGGSICGALDVTGAAITVEDCTPANDLCADAEVIGCGDVVSGDFTYATEDLPTNDCGNSYGQGVWYVFAGTGDQVTVSTCGGTTDTEITVLEGDCNALTCVDNDDDGCGLQSTVTFLSEVGTDYYVYVSWWSGSSTPSAGAFDLTVECEVPPTPPANDDCAGAESLTVGTSCTATAGDVAGATESLAGCAGTAGDDVWYSFVATEETATVDVTGSTSFDAVFEVFEGTCGTLTSLECVDNSFSGDLESTNLTGLTVGNTYYIRVYDWFADAPATTTFDICVYSTPAPPANDDCAGAQQLQVGTSCVATTGDVTAATESEPGCAGTADDDVWFSFVADAATATVDVTGSSDFDAVLEVLEGACGSLTSLECIDATLDGETETVDLTGLTPGNTYYIRVYDWYNGAPTTKTFDICVYNVVTGISEALNSGMSVYPNPSNGAFVVEITGVESMAQINVLDLTGRVVYTEGAMLNGNFRKDVNLNVASGTYLLQVMTEEGMVTRKLQVK